MDLTQSVAQDIRTVLDRFLADVEKRAFRIAHLAVRNEQDALDIVQDAMFSLCRSYGQQDPEVWKPLFYRILENRIMDHHRKETLRRKWFFWRSANEDEEADEIGQQLEDAGADPANLLVQEQMGSDMLAVLESLPIKQQQCFLLRCWEGLSVKETAEAMGVNEGSVKTHYFRAMQKLQTVIEP